VSTVASKSPRMRPGPTLRTLAGVTTSILWFRRDLRLHDQPALLAARDSAEQVLPLFVLDPMLLKPSGPARLAFLFGCLRELLDRTDGNLIVAQGKPQTVVCEIARQLDAAEIHISADFGPYGRQRDAEVAEALNRDGRTLVTTGSPYAVAPGRILKGDGTPYQVFTPFSRAWNDHGWRAPALPARKVAWATYDGRRRHRIPADPSLKGIQLPEPGEQAARRLLTDFVPQVAEYRSERDRPDRAGTSRLSAALKYGCLHPRTVLARIAEHPGEGATTFRTELAWREFYADVLFHRPQTARQAMNTQLRGIQLDEGSSADERFAAWSRGQTGYPIVDAGMRQLLAEAWMHNRVRLIVASFLVKDLHLDWTRGARWFMTQLADGDLASNSHGWQWVAGTGTDAAPYFRVFNPISQGERFDPDGDYVRRWVPELRGVAGKKVHRPWEAVSPPAGYPAPIVDHAAEREEALRRYADVRAGGR
jgi:deoxyribodipyrimidine photo-lyase